MHSMKKLIAILLIGCLSCNDYKTNYYFPDSQKGVFAVIYNSKIGIKSELNKGEFHFPFDNGHILLVQEPQPQGKGQTHFYFVNKNKEITKDIPMKEGDKASYQDVVVSTATINTYTNVSGKQIDYDLIILSVNKPNSVDTQVKKDKEENLLIQKLHKQIDSLIGIGAL